MRRNLIVLMLAAVISGCNASSIKGKQVIETALFGPTKTDPDSLQQAANWKAFEESFKLENYLIPTIPSNDFISITHNAVIFISPDSLQIEQLIKANGEEDFYTVADDNQYFQYEAIEYLKEKKVEIFHPASRYIKFIAGKKEFYFDTKAKSASGWTTILFSPDQKAPKIINPAEIEFEYQEYYK